jgi:hypothetical protein
LCSPRSATAGGFSFAASSSSPSRPVLSLPSATKLEDV